jgi:hypothetical protein
MQPGTSNLMQEQCLVHWNSKLKFWWVRAKFCPNLPEKKEKKQWSRAFDCCHLSILVQKVYDVILAKQNVFLPNKNIFEL